MIRLRLFKFIFLFIFSFTIFSCLEEEEPDIFEPDLPNVPVERTSIITRTTAGKTNVRQGCLETNSRSVSISLWDHGNVDGDIVSFYVNNREVVSRFTLSGPNNKRTFDIVLPNNGFNFVTLVAHNLGDIPPNTATVSIDGKEFILESDLENNGAFDIVITGFDVNCSNSNNDPNVGGPTIPNTPSTPSTPSTGTVSFFSTKDFNCGNITVRVNNNQTRVLTEFYSRGLLNCNQGGIIELPPGNHNFEATCPGGLIWNGNINIIEGGCLRFELK